MAAAFMRALITWAHRPPKTSTMMVIPTGIVCSTELIRVVRALEHETRLAEIVLSKTKTIPADEVVRVLTAHGIAAAKITKPVAERAGMKSLINRRIDVDAKT
jgi:hypothetical protein